MAPNIWGYGAQPQLSTGVGFGATPHALHRSRGSRGWPLGVSIITIYPHPKALIWRGIWGAAPRLSAGVGFGAAPHGPLQEQGFKGLAPWCINNQCILLFFLPPIYPQNTVHLSHINSHHIPHLCSQIWCI